MKDAIEEYVKENDGKVPEKVIVFRDGVSRFALKDVKNSEIKGIRLAFDEIKKKYQKSPKLIFLLVNKKIDAKFFIEGKSGGRGGGGRGRGGYNNRNRGGGGRGGGSGIINPNPGTVISDEVTGENDFYLVSIKTR